MKTLKLYALLFLFFLGNIYLQAEKKYLPHRISFDEAIMTFSYDDKNRFTCIETENIDEGVIYEVSVDSITYASDGSGYTISRYILKYQEADDSEPIYERINTSNFVLETKNEKQIVLEIRDDDENNKVYFDVTSSGKILSMGISDDKKSTMHFRFDENNNIIRWELSPNNNFLEFYSYMSYCRFHYDNKNGIFKHVDRTPLTLFYTITDMPYMFYLENNLTKIEENGRSGYTEETKYIYNKDGYPVSAMLSDSDTPSFEVTYIEAK